MRKLKVITMGVGLMMLAAIIALVDPSNMFDALRRVSSRHVVAALIVVQVQIVVSALRWRFTAARLGQAISAPVAIREYYLGSVLNQMLPGGIVGDATRIYRSSNEQSGSGWKRAATAVVLERLSGQLAFFLLTCFGIAAWAILLPETMPIDAAPLVWTTIAVVTVLSVAAGWLRKPLEVRFGHLGADMAAAFWGKGALGIQAGLSMLVVGTYVATFLIASDAIGAPLPPIAAVTAVPLCLLTMLVPIGVGGWGTREAAAVALWPVFGFTGAEGLAASVLYGIFSLAGTALPGLVVMAISLTGKLKRQP